ncbi:unnamed protein product [Heterobilharzia americana]|nr:unnamed protein product [Heterobilharzia americana]
MFDSSCLFLFLYLLHSTKSNRAVSTSSIDRQVTYCKRKLSTHSYVPRHFSGTISRQSSASQDVHTIDWSDSKYYNEQYNFINHVVKDPSSRYLSKDSVNISKPSENASTFSSSCSLTSESYPRPVSYDEPLEYTQFLLTSKNDLSHLQICELDYSADEKDTSPMSVISTRENIQSFTNSIQSPLMLSVNQTCEKETYDIHKKCNDRLTEKEDFSTSNKSLHKLISDVDSQQTIASTDTDNDEEAFSKLTNNVSLKKVITSVNAYSIVNHQIMEDNNIYEPYSPSQVSGGNFEVFSQDDDTRQSEEEKRNEDDRSNQSKSETDPGQNETASVDVSLVDLHSPRKSRDNSLFNSLIAFSEDISSKDDKSRLASMTDVAQSELLDDLESDIQSDQLMNVDEAPESLADAISLGAISLITGLSDDDSGGDDDNLYNSKHDDILNKTSVCRDSDQGSKVKLSKSLSHLPVTKNNSHLRQNTSSNMDNVEAGKTKIESSALTTCELVRAKSQQLFSKCTTPSRHSPKESDSLIPSMLSSHNISTPDFNGTSHKVDQNISELLTIASGCLNIFKEVLLTESMYSHQLEFLLTTPLDMASLFNVIPLMNWLQNRLLPLLKPIIDRQKSFLHQLKIIVSTLKHIISRVKVFSKQLLSKSKDDGVESLFQSSKINHESSMFTNRMSKVYLSSSESSLSHTVPQLNKNEDFSSSELSSFYLSPHFIKHKHKKCGMHSALKELQSLSCCVNLLMNLLDQLQCYEIWIKNSANLLSELWMLAFLDILGLHSNRDTELVNSHINVNTDSQIDKMQVANTENHFDNSVKYSPALIRKVLCDLENRSSIGSLWDYLLLPSRRFRSYCNLLQSIVNQLSEHSSSVLCQTVFSQFVLSRRSLINILDQTERVALALQLSIIVFPLDKFFYTSDNYVNENAQERDNLANDGQKHQNNTSTTYQSYSKYDNDEDIIESLQINSTALLDSLNRCPVIRFGWLNKYSRHGFQPRLVFLFTEHLIYASRIRGVAGLYLKIHGIISLSNIAVERNVPRKDHGSSDETSDQNKQLKCFKFGLVVTYSSHSPVHGLSEESNSCVTSRNSNPSRVSKSQSPCRYRLRRHRKRFIFGVYDEFDYEAWIGDISRLAAEVTTGTTASLSNINDSRIPNRTQLYKHTVAQRCLTDVNTNRYPSDSDVIQSSPQKSTALIPSFRNNLIGFCWRQHASVSSVQLLNIIDNEISGYLFRLSKRGTGSKQKLWTVLSDMCLKFYKTYHHHKLLARLWLSTNKCTAELLPTNLLPFGYNLNEFEADEHHRRHCVRYSYFIKISNNSKDYYFQAENDFFLKRWYTAISNTLTCSTTKLNRIETTLTDDNLILVNESLSTLSLLTTSDAKLIFTCRPLCSDKLKE